MLPTKPTQVTQRYFDLSNQRNLTEIFALFAEDATYSSDNTGLYFGLPAIREMVTAFYESFPYLHWEIHAMQESSSHIAEVEFTLTARDHEGSEIIRPGIERVVVADGLIRHVEVRNR